MPNLSQLVTKKTSCLKKRIYDTCTIESNICQWWFLGLVIAIQLWPSPWGIWPLVFVLAQFVDRKIDQLSNKSKTEHLWALRQKFKYAYNKKIF